MILTACSDGKDVKTDPDDPKSDEVSEPVMVGGSFLIECAPVEVEEPTIGCRTPSESNSLTDIETRAYFAEGDAIFIADTRLGDGKWELLFPVPDIDLSVATFNLELIGDDGDASYTHSESLADFYKN